MKYELVCFFTSSLEGRGSGVHLYTYDIKGGLDKAYPLDPLLMHPDICCGSDALTRDVSTEKTGRFQRHAVGGSIKVQLVDWNWFTCINSVSRGILRLAHPVPPQVSNSSSSNVDVTPPGKIRDLRALFDRAKAAVTISFTSPGDDYGQGRGKLGPESSQWSRSAVNFLATKICQITSQCCPLLVILAPDDQGTL